jgi:hypothetical protein
MYGALKPDALPKLKDSSELFRDRDNTIYHRGYPLNYRQDGVPSIQFSMAKDGRHADIDVDYRSSSFPAGLFNGHLTAANSDVRAGNNTQIHLQRWRGCECGKCTVRGSQRSDRHKPCDGQSQSGERSRRGPARSSQ